MEQPSHGPIWYNGKPYEVQYANIVADSSGDNTLVSGTALYKIVLVHLAIFPRATVDVYIHDSTPTALMGNSSHKINIPVGGGFIVPHSPLGVLKCATGTDLVLNLSSAVSCPGCLSYIKVLA